MRLRRESLFEVIAISRSIIAAAVALITVTGSFFASESLLYSAPQSQQDTAKSTIAFASSRFGRPPLEYLYFDVTLVNESAESRWFLLPSNMGEGHASVGKGGVTSIEVIAPKGEGTVFIGHFLGTGGFRAALLAPHGSIVIRNFPVSYWGRKAPEIDIELVSAREVKIGAEAIEKWFGRSPESSRTAAVALGVSESSDTIFARNSKDDVEQAVTLAGESRSKIHVRIDQNKPVQDAGPN